MPGSRQSPTLRRRRLSTELRVLRESIGMTSVEATKRLEWGGGKLTKMERREWVRPNPRDIQDLCDLYGVTDERQREYLITLARQGRERGWWHSYRDMLSEEYTTYIGLEAGAATVFVADLVVIPGLLQTEAYARAVVVGGPAEITAEQIDRKVKLRMERQKLITRPDDPLRLWVVIDEAALHREVGSSDVMREQLNHICELAALARVTVQVIPFKAGAHAAASGAFAILQFPEEEDPDAVYVENPAGELFVELPDEVERFHTAYRRLQATALSHEASINLITDYAAKT
ncbi:helix-turn-helix domain-containing protein [Actinomadura rudentiformis]|uniref:Helix-turn-helix domain-containing protein n=1 Tax=Actinomadura rudentiformis TaxID=359158 RepID=A0A6H9YVA9_9ACTN|nr:helix-turn-helix transcriptional regulator [Actinomadura rudentiformis]KAB2347546.1 helix-turn-helix domain-containing protein [Actinomadura rudentiformis]